MRPNRQVGGFPSVSAQMLGSNRTPGYVSPLSGKYISTMRERREEMARYGVREAE